MPTINWSYLCLALFLGLMASLCWQIGRTESPTESSTVLAWGGVAGYVLADSGRRYVLVAIVNHPQAGAARPALDALVQWVMRDAPAR